MAAIYLDSKAEGITMSGWTVGPRSGFAPMAHPMRKFGDVVQHPDYGPRVFIVAQIDTTYRGITLDSGLAYSIPVEIAEQWELVPEPDD